VLLPFVDPLLAVVALVAGVFRGFFREALESGGAFVVIDRSTGRIIGSSRYFGYSEERSEIEIGWTFREP